MASKSKSGHDEVVSITDTEEITFANSGGSGHVGGLMHTDLADGETTLTLHNWSSTLAVSVSHELDGVEVVGCAHLDVDEARTLRDELDAVISDHE